MVLLLETIYFQSLSTFAVIPFVEYFIAQFIVYTHLLIAHLPTNLILAEDGIANLILLNTKSISDKRKCYSNEKSFPAIMLLSWHKLSTRAQACKVIV